MTPLGERLEKPEHYISSPTVPVRVVLEDIRSGVNVGSFFRTADALRLEGIDLCGYTANPPHKDIMKSALGASEHVPWRVFENAAIALEQLQSEGYKIAAVEQFPGSMDLNAWQPQPLEKWALVFGNEVRGVQRTTCEQSDLVLELPQFGVKQSLNVSVCGGIVLWHATQHIGRP
jgi:23S rRNA (guanosine2251-2'-O)-methyltransferase